MGYRVKWQMPEQERIISPPAVYREPLHAFRYADVVSAMEFEGVRPATVWVEDEDGNRIERL